ncbi:MAG: hypothetical protein K2N03_06415 [Muribaculaceae bacterium]|nr:hypothetical protein [Muribaculaceae bacterium]
MKIFRQIVRLAVICGLPAVLLLLTSCKGRTADNVEPTGETIEVEIPIDSTR